MRSKYWSVALSFWLIAFCFVPSAMASVSWYKSFNGLNPKIDFTDIAPTNDGGSIVLGRTQTYPSNLIAYKLDKLGSIQWQKILGSDLGPPKVIQTSDGGYAILGVSTGANTHLFKLRFDGTGEWHKVISGGYTAEGNSVGFQIIIQSDDGGFLLFNGPELVKIDSQGNFIKKTRYIKPDGATIGGNAWNSTAKTPEGDLIVSIIDEYWYIGKGLYILKLKHDGTIIWQKKVDYRSFTTISPDVHAINCTPDGGFVVGLSFFGQFYNALLKFDSTGQLQFQKKIYIESGSDRLLRDIIVTPDNGYLIGYGVMYMRNIDQYVAPVYKFNNIGESQWSIHGPERKIWKKMADDSLMSIEVTPSSNPNILSKTSNLLNLSGCDPIYGSIPAPVVSDFSFQVLDAALSVTSTNRPPDINELSTFSTSDFMQPAPNNSCFRKPIISTSSASIDFGSAKLNQTVTKDLVITNSGDASLNIRQVHQPDSPNFTVSGTCSFFAPKASCTLTLTFTPTALGMVAGMLAIDSDDPYKPTEFVALSGSSSDSTPPLTSYYLSGTAGLNGWFTSDVAVSLEATDADSGVDSITYSINGIQVRYPGSAVKFNVVEEKVNAIAFYAIDNAGNQESATPVPVNIDKTVPTITASVSPAPNSAGWYNTNATVSFACSDATSGIAECPAAVTLSRDGAGQIVSGKAVDKAGNSSQTAVTLNLDMTAPVIVVNGVKDGAKYQVGFVPTATYSVSDSQSGVVASSVTLTGGDGLGLGTFTYKVAASDVAGNTANVTVSYEVIATPEGLIALIRQMLASGKIDNAGIANSLISKVENAQKANGNAADNIMQAFINQVEAQSGKHIASDAASILIHAAEYVVSH